MTFANSVRFAAALATMKNVDGYSAAGAASKTTFHREGKKFLKELAAALGTLGAFTVRSNLAGIAVSGEVTLHADHIYITLSEGYPQPGITMMYRSCKSQKDYTGGHNNFVSMAKFGDYEEQQRILRNLRSIIGAEIARKEQAAASKAPGKVAVNAA